jgi:hypothetical protein
MTNPKKVKQDIQNDLTNAQASNAQASSAQASASQANPSATAASTSTAGFTSSLSGSDANQVKNEIQQDLTNSTSFGLTSGTNPQKVRKDMQQSQQRQQ